MKENYFLKVFDKLSCGFEELGSLKGEYDIVLGLTPNQYRIVADMLSESPIKDNGITYDLYGNDKSVELCPVHKSDSLLAFRRGMVTFYCYKSGELMDALKGVVKDEKA